MTAPDLHLVDAPDEALTPEEARRLLRAKLRYGVAREYHGGVWIDTSEFMRLGRLAEIAAFREPEVPPALALVVIALLITAFGLGFLAAAVL